MSFNPCTSLLRTIGLAISGRIKFPRKRAGEVLISENGQQFTIFRQVIVKAGKNQPDKPDALFRVQFRVANMTPRQNKLFSLLPIPFFIGLPGFRSKLWMVDKSNGDCQGIYEWDTLRAAEKYAHSFAMKFMTLRSVPGSVSHSINSIKGPRIK